MTGLHFDGRKDSTYVTQGCAATAEEHVVVIAKPGNRYITHFTPESGRALHLLNELHSVNLQFRGQVKVLRCDGTAVNTGTSGGVCRLFELVTETPVHWFVCQLHGNELNLRHLLATLDGTTTGPKSFSGPIGKACAGQVWERDVLEFEPILGHVPDLLYLLASGVQSGSIQSTVARRRIGPLNHAR